MENDEDASLDKDLGKKFKDLEYFARKSQPHFASDNRGLALTSQSQAPLSRFSLYSQSQAEPQVSASSLSLK